MTLSVSSTKALTFQFQPSVFWVLFCIHCHLHQVYLLCHSLKGYSPEVYGRNELKSISSYRKIDTNQYSFSNAFFYLLAWFQSCSSMHP